MFGQIEDVAPDGRGPSSIRTPYPRRTYAMTRNARIKSIVRGAKYKAHQAEGRAKQTAGNATGKDSLRRQGKAEELKSRLNQFANKIKDAISR
jgi:uncharacterized protein YjbJ (UPF0337 family)